MSKKIIISVTNDLINDQRIDRISNSLTKAGVEVLLVGRFRKNSSAINIRDYKTLRFKLLVERGFLFYAVYNIRLFIFLLFNRADALLSNDMDTLPANFLAAKFKRIPVYFDSHEYFSEVPEIINRKYVKKIWIFFENLLLPKIKFSYTVCKSIAKIYKDKYHIDSHVIRNLPYKKVDLIQALPEELIPFKDIRKIIYQGSLNIGRGLEMMVETMRFLENTVFIIAGEGDISARLRKKVSENNLSNKVVFLGKIPIYELYRYTVNADLGISLEENLGLNYYYALPNKLFDYIQAQVPVLVSDFPEMSSVVNNFKIGLTTNERSPEKLAAIIQEAFDDRNRYNQWKNNLKEAANELCWENEENKLINLFQLSKLI
jgi:glycosyltransferase involved in cell wall biosynthesis